MIVNQLESGISVGDGAYSLIERTSFLGAPVGLEELPWTDVPLLTDLGSASASRGVVALTSRHVEAWSEFFKSSYYMSNSAGRGAFGEVWRGISLDEFRTRVVLKRIFRSAGPEGVSSAMREVYFGEKFGHSLHTSRFVTHFLDQGDLWLVFIDEGVSLYQALFKPKIVGELSIMTRSKFWRELRVGRPELLPAIMRQVFAGIAEIHALNILHRDIKLENILLDPVRFNVRVADFGSASPLGGTDAELVALFPPNGPSVREETARYAAPDGHMSKWYDLWCASIVWVELFLGSIDLSGLNDHEWASVDSFSRAVKQRDPLGEGLSKQVANVIYKIRTKALLDATQVLYELDDDLLAWNTRFSSQGSRSRMEDFSLTSEHKGSYLACVMDGHNGPEVAEFIRDRFGSLVWEQSDGDALGKAQILLNQQVGKMDIPPDCGSTLACVLVRGNTMWVSNVGDSRVVLVTHQWEPQVGGKIVWEKHGQKFRGVIANLIDSEKLLVVPENTPNRKTIVSYSAVQSGVFPAVHARELTKDHKPGDPAEKNFIEQTGGYVEDSTIPRVNGVLAVSRSIGALKWKPWVRSEPDIVSAEVPNAGFLILATDGVWDVMSAQEAAELGSPAAIVGRALELGGRDNMVVVKVFLDRLVRPPFKDEL